MKAKADDIADAALSGKLDGEIFATRERLKELEGQKKEQLRESLKELVQYKYLFGVW